MVVQISENARQTYKEIKRLAQIEADRGADVNDVIVSMLDHNLIYDGVNQRQYMNIKVFDVFGAMYIYQIEKALNILIRKEEDKDKPNYNRIKMLEKQIEELTA